MNVQLPVKISNENYSETKSNFNYDVNHKTSQMVLEKLSRNRSNKIHKQTLLLSLEPFQYAGIPSNIIDGPIIGGGTTSG